MPEPNDASKRRIEPGTADDQSTGTPVRRAKNVSSKPLPELSEKGGVEPVERSPSEYNDRTRDRKLEES